MTVGWNSVSERDNRNRGRRSEAGKDRKNGMQRDAAFQEPFYELWLLYVKSVTQSSQHVNEGKQRKDACSTYNNQQDASSMSSSKTAISSQ